jgi:hypothetical protein
LIIQLLPDHAFSYLLAYNAPIDTKDLVLGGHTKEHIQLEYEMVVAGTESADQFCDPHYQYLFHERKYARYSGKVAYCAARNARGNTGRFLALRGLTRPFERSRRRSGTLSRDLVCPSTGALGFNNEQQEKRTWCLKQQQLFQRARRIEYQR